VLIDSEQQRFEDTVPKEIGKRAMKEMRIDLI